MALLIISRTTSVDYKSMDSGNVIDYIGKECYDLVFCLISSVERYYYVDLTEPEFFVRFALHINNLLIRAKNNYFSKNPLADSIRSSSPLIYEVSVFLANLIYEKTNTKLNKDEIAYIAFHIGSSIGAQKELNKKTTAVLYCPQYYDTVTNLVNTINFHFSNELLITNISISESDLGKSANSDLIISTVPIDNTSDTPVLYVNMFLQEKDINSIRQTIEKIKLSKRRTVFKRHLQNLVTPNFFEKKNSLVSQDDAIDYMVEKMQSLGYIGKSFKKQIIERELLSSTVFNNFAIPHSMQMCAHKTGINIVVSEQPIMWYGTPVYLIIMLSVNEYERDIFHEIFDPLILILNEPENVLRLVKCDNYNECISLLVSLLN